MLHRYVSPKIPANLAVGPATRWLASVNTQYNPAFGLTNLTRDVLGGVIHLGNTELRGKALKVLLNTPIAIVGIARELSSRGQSGKWQTLYRQFQADGGQTGFKEAFRDPNERAKAIEAELKLLGRSKLNPARAAHAILDLLDGFNTTLENAVRLSAYSEALDKGISRANAARLGRELTVDFNRKGRMGAELGPLYAFFNASVQGTSRSMQALKGPTGKKIIAGGLSLGVVQALMLLMAGYDEDEIPEFVKARALVIPTGTNSKGIKTHVFIPYPLGLHVIPNTGRVLSELALNGGKDIGKRTGSAVGEIAGAFNPLGGGNIFEMDGALKTVLPTLIDPFIEMGFNRNFAGNSIQREGYGDERDNRPGVARTKESTMKTTTGQAYMGISKAINTLTGGTDYERGMASPTPEMVRYMAQTVGGGVLREIEKTINSSTAASRGEQVKPSGIPVLGRFYGEVDDNQVQMSRYYTASNNIAKLSSTIKAMEKAGDGAAMEKFVESNPGVALIQTHNKLGVSIAKLNKMAVETVGNPEALAMVDEARIGLMGALNQAVADVNKKPGKVTLADMIRPKAKAVEQAAN
jgi:Large polyvalent protein associated domain 38